MFFYEMVLFVSLGIVKLCLRQPRTLKSANLSYEKVGSTRARPNVW